jgi:hypothetical protein
MDATSAVTTLALVNGAIDAAKKSVGLVKDVNNHELKLQVSEVLNSILDLKVRILDLDEENRTLKAELQKEAEIEGPNPPFGYFFSKLHPDKPLCPKCYQSEARRLSFMTEPFPFSYGIRRDCRLCRHTIWEKQPDYSQQHEPTPYTDFSA